MKIKQIQIFKVKRILKENVHCGCLSMKLLDSVVRVGKKYYSQGFLEECKYEIEKKT